MVENAVETILFRNFFAAHVELNYARALYMLGVVPVINPRLAKSGYGCKCSRIPNSAMFRSDASDENMMQAAKVLRVKLIVCTMCICTDLPRTQCLSSIQTSYIMPTLCSVMSSMLPHSDVFAGKVKQAWCVQHVSEAIISLYVMSCEYQAHAPRPCCTMLNELSLSRANVSVYDFREDRGCKLFTT